MTAYEVLAEPKRRLILELLAQEELPVGELVRRLGMSQPLVSKHLRVLRESGLVSSRTDAQRRFYSIEVGPLADIDAWIARFRPMWTTALDNLEAILDKDPGLEEE
jgi:DNA-binding transcriptional ArsR family regulator